VSSRRRIYDWQVIRCFHESGKTMRECQEWFGFSNGAWHSAVERGEITSRVQPGSKPRGATRKAVAKLLADGFSQAQIADELAVSRPTVCFHMRKLGIPVKSELARRYDWNEIRDFYEAGHSFRECQREFGFSRDAWADGVRRGAIEPRPRAEPIELLLIAGKRRSRYHVKGRLLLAGLKEPRCEHCGLTHWREQPISFELHHVNGDGKDNRLENLLLRCPNCHSQTDTWGGRNKARRAAA
jgi:predicted DNA-binding protein YlxM (UPF0122 family)